MNASKLTAQKVGDLSHNNGRRKRHYSLVFFFLFSVLILAVTKLRDPDIWTHLNMGRQIFNLKAIPGTEPFLYTATDNQFVYGSWLFGLMTYLVFHAFDFYGIIMLKALMIAAAFGILLRDSLRPHRNYVLAVCVMGLIVILVRERFVERPDTALMLFLSYSIFSLNAFLYDNNKKYLYTLPAAHFLWANLHSSITLMFVPFLAFIVGGMCGRYLERRGIGERTNLDNSRIAAIAVVFALSAGAALINPDGLSQFFFGWKFLSSDLLKMLVQELRPPVGVKLNLLYITGFFIIISFLLNHKKIQVIHFLLVVPFLYVPFTADRFFMLMPLVGGPVFIRNISNFLKTGGWEYLFRGKAAVFFTFVWVCLYSGLALAKVGPFGVTDMEWGFGVDYSLVSKGAVEYLDRRDITGRVLNEFGDGQYIIWRGYPSRTVFIDGRGIISPDLLEKAIIYRFNNAVLDDLSRSFGFETIVMRYPMDVVYQGMHDFRFTHPQWALVYWDDVSMVFLKRGGHYEKVIRYDEYKFVKPDMSLYYFINMLSERRDDIVEQHIEDDLKRNVRETGSSLGKIFLGSLYAKRERYREASNSFAGVRHYLYRTHLYIANILAGQSAEQLGDLADALWYYEEALVIETDAATLIRTADLYLRLNRPKKAEKVCRKALQLDPKATEAYPLLIRAYEKMGSAKEAARIRNEFRALQIQSGRANH